MPQETAVGAALELSVLFKANPQLSELVWHIPDLDEPLYGIPPPAENRSAESRDIEEYPPITSGKFTSTLTINTDDMTHTATLTIAEVTEADLGKEFMLNALNYYGETNYTVTLENIGGL